jgi:hypothetical protein
VRMAARSRFCLINGDRLTLARTDGRSSANAQLCERVCRAPQSNCRTEWLNAELCPPCCFVARSMNFAVMPAAQGDRELITHLSSKCSALCKSEVVRIPDAGRKSNKDVLRRISRALDRGLVAAQGG